MLREHTVAGILALVLMSTIRLSALIPPPDLQNRTTVRSEMMVFNPRYAMLMEPRSQAFRQLEQQVRTREAEMRDMSCSHQIVTELGWLIGSTVDTERIDARLADLRASLAHPELEAKAREQQEDGSWGRCYEAWFFRLDASYDGHFSRDQGTKDIPLLDRVNSPQKLAAYMNSVSISDVRHSGVNHRREMNEALATLIRLILHDQPRAYRWHPELKATLLNLLMQMRDPDTGWWGERYQRSGQIEFVDDLSMTFHVVSYLKGQISDLDKVGNTLLELKELEYPVGWLDGGSYLTHHNMDVVVLFQYAWPRMTEGQRREASIEIDKMLRWCLRDAVLPDGSFREGTGGEDSLEENEYFGVAFLARAGYFDVSRRFWTDQPFPQADHLRHRLIYFIQQHRASGAAGGAYYESALRELGAPAQ